MRYVKLKIFLGILLGCVTFFLCPINPCRALDYKPKPGETLSFIALLHYGNPDKYIYLSTANAIADPNKIPENTTLWVPTVWKYRIKKGDYLAKLATQYLRDAKRSDFLRWLNKIRDPLDINPGTLITMPFVLRHKVLPGETLFNLAEKYYQQPKKILGWLRNFNQKKSNQIKTGEIIELPIFDEEASYAKVKDRLKRHDSQENQPQKNPSEHTKKSSSLEADPATSKTTSPAGTSSSFWSFDLLSFLDRGENHSDHRLSDTDLVKLAIDLYWNGEYEETEEMISEAIKTRTLSNDIEVKLIEISAWSLVAMDRIREAEKQFHRLLDLNPKRSMDPVKISPKIISVFEQARSSHQPQKQP